MVRNFRQSRARPLLGQLRKWMEKTLHSLSAKSETAAAIRYALSRWRALNRYTEDGLPEIDNSAAERALRAGRYPPEDELRLAPKWQIPVRPNLTNTDLID
jgi:hypothetical protein